MFIRIQDPAIKTWKRITNLVNTLWSRLHLPASPFLALTHPSSPIIATEMPRTRRRHHSNDRSSGGHRDKRRRVDSEEASPLPTDISSPPRTRYTRSDAKKRHHESDVSSRVSKDSSPIVDDFGKLYNDLFGKRTAYMECLDNMIGV